MANENDELAKLITSVIKKAIQNINTKEISSNVENSVNNISSSKKANESGIGECTIFQW